MTSLWRYIVAVVLLGLSGLLQASVVTSYQSVSTEDENWQTLTSPHFQVHYTEGQEQWAIYSANVAEDFHRSISKELQWIPAHKTQMVLTDNYDFSNGWASTSPFENIRLILSPPDGSSSLEDYDDWLKILIIHEYTHIMHLDKVDGFYKVMRKILGRNFLFFPNAWQPRWLIEGYATYKETDYEEGFGRGQSSGYHMRMRAEVLHGLKDVQQVNAHAREWPGGSAYLYGAYFMQFISEKYGAEKLNKYIRYYSRNVIPYWLSPTADKVFDKDFLKLWAEFQQHLKDKFEPELATLEQSGLKQGAKALAHSLSNSDQVAHKGSLYFTLSQRAQPSYLSKMDSNGNLEQLVKIYHSSGFDINDRGDVIISQFRPHANNRYYQDLFLISSIDKPQQSQMMRLTEQQRWRNPKWYNDQQIIAKRIINSYSELALIDTQGTVVKTLWKGKPGEVLGDFDVQDGRIIAALKRAGLDWDIAQFDFNSQQWKLLIAHQGIEQHPKFATDGRSILYAADYQDSFNVYRYDIDSGQITQVSRVDTGGLQPSEFNQNVYYWYYGKQGYELRQIDSNGIQFVTPKAQGETQFSYDFENKGYSIAPYSALDTLRPYWWWPILEVDESKTLFGFITGGNDALVKHSYSLMVQLDPEYSEYKFDATYQYANKLYFSLNRELEHYADPSNDEVFAITAENGADIAAFNLLSGMDGDLALHGGANWQREFVVYDRFDTNQDFGVREATAAGLGLVFSNQEQYVDSAGPAYGFRLAGKVGSYDLIDDDFEGNLYGLSYTHRFGFDNGSVLSLHMEYGQADEEAPILFLGGDQSRMSTIDYFQNDYNLRGFNEGQFIGDSVQTNTIEWRTKLSRIESTWGMLPIGLNDIELTLFSDFAAVNNSNFERVGLENWLERMGVNAADIDGEYHFSTGIELKAELNFGFNAIVPLHLGFAKGYGDYGDDEFYARFGYAF